MKTRAPRRAAVGAAVRAALLCAVLLAAAPSGLVAQQPAGRVHGEIRDEATQRLLAGAEVTLSSDRGRVVVQTDSLGRYQARVPAGRQRLAVRHLSHVPLQLEVIVPEGGTVMLDLALRAQPLVLAPVRVDAERSSRGAEAAPAPPAELARAGARGVESVPGLTELGVGGGGRGPGQQPVDPSDVLFVRGSAADLKLVLLDGAPVYSPFHLGGLISVFEPTTLRAAEMHLAGAPARYDGGLAYVMELETRRGRRDRVHATARADALLAAAAIEAPLGPHAGVFFSGRTVHGLGVSPMLSVSLPYDYDEALLRADVDLAPDHALRLTSFVNREAVALGAVALPDSMARWANTAVSLRYLGRFGARRVESTLAYTTFDTRLPLGGSRGLDAQSRAERLRGHLELSQPLGASVLRYGVSADRLSLHTRLTAIADFEGPGSGTNDVATAGLYVDASHPLLRRLHLRGGLRGDVFSSDAGVRLAPRLSATWLVSESAALTLAAGRYHQQVRAPDSTWIVISETDYPAGSSPPPLISVAQATHVALGLDQRFGEEVQLGVEGFFKQFEEIPGAFSSRASASGMDLYVRGAHAGRSAWLGYSLAWVWSVADSGGSTNQFSGRQMLNAGLSGPLAGGLDVELGFTYGAGLPFTAVPVAMPASDGTRSEPQHGNVVGSGQTPPLSSPPDDPYLRLDLTLSRTWEPAWNGARHRFTPYVRVLNALDRRDSMFYRRNSGTPTGPEPLSPLPLLPVVGLSWTF